MVLAILFVKQDPADIGEIPDSRAWVERHPLPEKSGAPVAEAEKKAYATIYSTLNVIGSIAGIVVPMLVSAIQKTSGNYVVPYTMAVVLLVVGGVMTLIVHPASEQN